MARAASCPEWAGPPGRCYSRATYGDTEMAVGTRRPRRRTAKEHGPDPVDIHVGQQLRNARTLARLTQAEFGRRLRMSFQLVQKYEQGEIRIAASRLYRMARLLGQPVAYFYAGLADGGGAPDALARQEV